MVCSYLLRSSAPSGGSGWLGWDTGFRETRTFVCTGATCRRGFFSSIAVSKKPKRQLPPPAPRLKRELQSFRGVNFLRGSAPREGFLRGRGLFGVVPLSQPPPAGSGAGRWEQPEGSGSPLPCAQHPAGAGGVGWGGMRGWLAPGSRRGRGYGGALPQGGPRRGVFPGRALRRRRPGRGLPGGARRGRGCEGPWGAEPQPRRTRQPSSALPAFISFHF